jgi:hypothetical protein
MSYSTIKLPTEFVEKNIDPYVIKADGLDSRADLIKKAVMFWIEQKKGITLEPVKNELGGK